LEADSLYVQEKSRANSLHSNYLQTLSEFMVWCSIFNDNFKSPQEKLEEEQTEKGAYDLGAAIKIIQALKVQTDKKEDKEDKKEDNKEQQQQSKEETTKKNDEKKDEPMKHEKEQIPRQEDRKPQEQKEEPPKEQPPKVEQQPPKVEQPKKAEEIPMEDEQGLFFDEEMDEETRLAIEMSKQIFEEEQNRINQKIQQQENPPQLQEQEQQQQQEIKVEENKIE